MPDAVLSRSRADAEEQGRDYRDGSAGNFIARAGDVAVDAAETSARNRPQNKKHQYCRKESCGNNDFFRKQEKRESENAGVHREPPL